MERLKKSLLYTYGVADLCFTLMINTEMYFFASFLTDYAQFPFFMVAQILGVTGLIDVACALAGGVVLQKVTLRCGGKYRSWFLVGPPLLAPLFILQFTKLGGNSLAALIVMFGFVTSHLLFNVVFSANGAMLGRLSQLPDERTILSASRAQGMSLAGLIFSATAMPMVVFFSRHTAETAGFAIVAGIYAFLMVLGYWFIYWMTKGRDPYDEVSAHPARGGSTQSLREILGPVLRNPPLLYLILSQVFGNASYMIITSLAIYYFRYVLGNPSLLSFFIMLISLARLAGTFAARWIGVRCGKRSSYWIFSALAGVASVCTRFLNEPLWVFLALFMISISFMSVASSMTTALLADTVVYGEWKTGSSIRAFTMALMNLPIKVAVLLRSAVVTSGLMMIGFVANAAPGPGVVAGIRSMMTVVPALAYAIGALVFYFGYRIEEAHVLRMQDEIAARRADERAATPGAGAPAGARSDGNLSTRPDTAPVFGGTQAPRVRAGGRCRHRSKK